MTNDRGDISVNLGPILHATLSSGVATFQYDCQWYIRPSDDESSIKLQFNSFSVPPSIANLVVSRLGLKHTACEDVFVEIRVSKNLVGRTIGLVTASKVSTFMITCPEIKCLQ